MSIDALKHFVLVHIQIALLESTIDKHVHKYFEPVKFNNFLGKRMPHNENILALIAL